MVETAITYKDRDNTFTVTFTLNGTTLPESQMSAITKIELKYGDNYYNSVDHPSGFVKDDASGQVTIKPYELGLDAGIDNATKIIVYDEGDYKHGLVWDIFKWIHRRDAVI